MKKILLILLVTNTTGAFAAIQWNCTTSLDTKFAPTGCSSASSSDVVTPSAPVTPVEPPAPVIKSSVSYNASIFDGLSECTGSSDVALSTVEACANSWLSGKTFGSNVPAINGVACTSQAPSWVISCGISLRSGSDTVSAYPFNSSTVDLYNRNLPFSSTNKLPSTGGIICRVSAMGMTGDSSLCPAGSYTEVFKNETITNEDGSTYTASHFDGYVLVQ